MNNEEKILEILGAMQKDIAGMKEDIKDLKHNQKFIWEDIGKLDIHIGKVEEDVKTVKRAVMLNTLDIDELKKA